jgi:hypothetical protein
MYSVGSIPIPIIHVLTEIRKHCINVNEFSTDIMYFFSIGATTHCGFVFCSPLAGYSLLAYEVS